MPPGHEEEETQHGGAGAEVLEDRHRGVGVRAGDQQPPPGGVGQHRVRPARARQLPLSRVPRDGRLPLSFAQQRLWYLDQLQPGTTLYSIPVAIQLTGPLDVVALEQSLAAIMDRLPEIGGFASCRLVDIDKTRVPLRPVPDKVFLPKPGQIDAVAVVAYPPGAA